MQLSVRGTRTMRRCLAGGKQAAAVSVGRRQERMGRVAGARYEKARTCCSVKQAAAATSVRSGC